MKLVRLMGYVSFWGTLVSVLGVIALLWGATSTSSTSLQDTLMVCFWGSLFAALCFGIGLLGALGKAHQPVKATQDKDPEYQRLLDEKRRGA